MAEAPPSPDPFLGELLEGRYKIVREIAVGGMSTVYEATHVKIGRTVAIKVLHREMASDPEAVARFINEAKAVGTFGHPNIVASTDFGELAGHVPFLVLEYLEGHTLGQEIAKNGPLSVRRVMRIAIQICSALDAAHVRGVIHRDLTSDNIFLIQADGNPDHVKVLDFGISKFLSGTESSPKTRRGLTMGTPEFMAPEQISDPQAVDARVDIYALGVIMYHMLAGRHPFSNMPLQSLLTSIVVEPPPAIERPGIPEGIRAIVLRALAKTPAERFANMRAMGVEMEQFSSFAFASDGNSGRVGAPMSMFGGSTRTYTNPKVELVPTSMPDSTVRVVSSVPAAAPAAASGNVNASPDASAIASPSNPATADAGVPSLVKKRVPKKLIYFAAGALGFAAVMATVMIGRGGGDHADHEAKRGEPTTSTPPAAATPSAPTAPAAARSVNLHLESPTRGARATLRRRTHVLPYDEDVTPGSQPEIVEVTAAGREGRRYWITFDHPVRLSLALPPGRGMVEATAEETLVALGEQPVDDAPDEAAQGESRRPVHHAANHPKAAPGASMTRPAAAAPATPGAQTGAKNEGKNEARNEARNEAKTEAKTAPASGATSAAATTPSPPADKPNAPASATTESQAATASAPQRSKATAPASAASVATPQASASSIDPAKVQAAVRTHLGEVQRCYERGKMDDPELKGRVAVRINISANGSVASAETESSTLGNSRVETCIVRAVQGWKFPTPNRGGAVISYPFNLR